MFANDGEDVAEVIASHHLHAYQAAGEDPDADELRAQSLAALKRAGQRAATVGAPEAAEDLYRTAIELAVDEAEASELTGAAAEAALSAGREKRRSSCGSRHRRPIVAAGGEHDAARIAANSHERYANLGRNEEAARRITAALEVLGSERLDPDVGLLNTALGRALVNTGDLRRRRRGDRDGADDRSGTPTADT